MAPPSGKRNRQQRDSLKAEDILQAIVIADNFNSRFDPITLNRPTVLLPLVNVPLLNYTLEFLCAAGVQEIFVFSCKHADVIRKYLENHGWLDESSRVFVSMIVSDDCLSVGDALREVDSKAMIRTDFILVFGDTVANLKLKDIMESHRRTKEKDKASVLTMVYKKATPKHHARCPEDDSILVVNNDNNKILDYRKTGNDPDFSIPVETFTQNKSVSIHYDLLNTHVCICSPLVPQLFTDNFDYCTMDDFVRGLLINEEILGNTMHIETVQDEYACRVSNIGMYDAVSRDVINRWTYPYVPEYMCSKDSISCGRHSLYTSHSVTLARGCVLEKNAVIGSGTRIGSDTRIINSVIGRNCHIGENVSMSGCYIWDNVTIDNNCTLDTCIVCDGCSIKQHVQISTGCVLSDNVEVGPDSIIPAHTLLTRDPHKEEDGFGDEDVKDIISQVVESSYGPKAYVYQAPCDSDDDDDIIHDTWGVTSRPDDDSDVSSVSSGDSDAMSRDSPPPDDTKVFFSEMFDTLRRAKEENIGADNQVLEINSLKHAYNISIKDVNIMVIQALLEMPLTEQPDLSTIQYFPALKKCLKTYSGLIQNYIKNRDSQLDCLQSLEEYSLQRNVVASSIVKVIHFLYDADIVLEEVIVSWYEKVADNEEKMERTELRKPIAPFIKWLQEADEESGDSGS